VVRLAATPRRAGIPARAKNRCGYASIADFDLRVGMLARPRETVASDRCYLALLSQRCDGWAARQCRLTWRPARTSPGKIAAHLSAPPCDRPGMLRVGRCAGKPIGSDSG